MSIPDACIMCGQQMLTPNRTGVCVNCRTVKCQAEGCKKTIRVKSFGINFCEQHAYLRRRGAKNYGY